MLCLVPRRAPFSDWCAQIERIIEKRTGEPFKLDRSLKSLLGCYEVGLSPIEIADDWSAWTAERKRK